MPLFSSVSFVTNIAKGYTLPQALGIAARNGFELAEIASIAGMCEHIAPSDITPEYIRSVSDMLARENMNSYAFAGHVDLTEEDGLSAFLKKMDLASGIGCKVINTNSGPAGRIGEFRVNIRKVIDKAERLGLTVCLESHGDIVGTAKDSAGLFREINHPLLRFNYDTGNTYYYAKGDVAIEEDILYALEYMAYVHVKDIEITGDAAHYRPIGAGDLDFEKIFGALRQFGKPLHCGLEIPVFVAGDLNALASSAAPIGEDEIAGALKQSLDCMRGQGAC